MVQLQFAPEFDASLFRLDWNIDRINKKMFYLWLKNMSLVLNFAHLG